MAAQKRESRRNYIDLVDDGDDGQRASAPRTNHGRPVRDYLRGLVAAMREARNEAN